MIFRLIKLIDVILGLGTLAKLLRNVTRFILQVEIPVLCPTEMAFRKTAIAA